MSANIVNREQAEEWNGAEGEHWVENDEIYSAASRRHQRHLFEALAIAPPERVLDFGCGCGDSTLEAARAARDGSVVAADISRPMLGRASERVSEAGLTNVSFVQADVQVHDFGAAAFDVALSRFGGMFFADPVAAYANVARALRPGGRLGLLVWQHLAQQAWLGAIRAALAAGRELPGGPAEGPSPFSLADTDGTRAMLERAGFTDVEFREVAEPMWFGFDAERAYEFWSGQGITRGLLQGLDERGKQHVLDALRDVMVRHQTPEGVLLDSRAWVITARSR